MKKPYNAARLKAFPFSDPLVKKLTVRGNIGKMQGINKAAKPPTKPAIKIPHKVLCSSFGGATACLTVAGAAAAILATVSGALIVLSGASGFISVKVRSSVPELSCAYPFKDMAQTNSKPRHIFFKDIIVLVMLLFYRNTKFNLLWR